MTGSANWKVRVVSETLTLLTYQNQVDSLLVSNPDIRDRVYKPLDPCMRKGGSSGSNGEKRGADKFYTKAAAVTTDPRR